MRSMDKRVDPAELKAFLISLLTAHDVSETHATQMADLLTWADLRAVASHGVRQVPRYIALLESGGINRHPKMVEMIVRPALARLYVDSAPGAVALGRAVQLGIEIAKTQGVAWVQVTKMAHGGAIGYFVEKAAEAGMIGLVMLAGMPNMAYPGAKPATVATSPIAIGIPSKDGQPFLLDMATAAIALAKIRLSRQRGEQLPVNSAVTAEGKPTTNPDEAAMPLPLGGMKGAGMSLAFELLTSVLSGQPILAPIHNKAEGARRYRQNAVMIVVDPSALGSSDEFMADVALTLETIRRLPTVDADSVVGIPGDRGRAAQRMRSEHGIPLSCSILQELANLASAKGLRPLTTRTG